MGADHDAELDEELLVPLTRYELWLCERAVDTEISALTMGYPQRPIIHQLRGLLTRLRYVREHGELAPVQRRRVEAPPDESPF